MRQFKVTKQITSRNSRAIEAYLAEISRFPVLTVSEEENLAMRSMCGDVEARERLVCCNLRFVVSIAKSYQGSKIPIEDLINEGNEGLITAAEKFDPTRGFRFISYAVWWIRQGITQYISENADLIKRPLNVVGVTTRLAKISNSVYVQTGETANKEQLLKEEGFTDKQIKNILDSEFVTVRGDQTVALDDTDTTFFDVIKSESTADDLVMKTDKAANILRVLDQTLNRKEYFIITHIYGLGCTPKSFEEIGDELGLTRERIRQLNVKITSKIRQKCGRALKEYL